MLAVDIGNSKTRIAAFRGERIVSLLDLPTRELDLLETMEAMASQAESLEDRAVWIASVYPGANAVVDSAAERLGLPRRFIRSGADHIVRNRLTTLGTTGVDRLLSALAAGRALFPNARDGYVVIQCGSAATIDFVDGDGYFVGGYIVPGPALWLSGLAGAAQLPDFSRETPDWHSVDPGDNTRDAILRGMALCLPSAVASAAFFLDKAGRGLPVAVTGGWGNEVIDYLDENAVWAPDLLLHGIRLFAERAGPARAESIL